MEIFDIEFTYSSNFANWKNGNHFGLVLLCVLRLGSSHEGSVYPAFSSSICTFQVRLTRRGWNIYQPALTLQVATYRVIHTISD